MAGDGKPRAVRIAKLVAGIVLAALWTAPIVWIAGQAADWAITTPVAERSAMELESPAWAAFSALIWSLVAFGATLLVGLPALLFSERKGISGARQAALVVGCASGAVCLVVVVVWVGVSLNAGRLQPEGLALLIPTALIAALMSGTVWLVGRR